ncbi:MAG: 2-oxo acid dehydrogenase subunit E2 [Treponema sp.]|jgi:pyruvate dehydrogenase E2 component (dihydrolipoamide acetyltransferase)|nr:2-oxo acid dehydrogenase subunit E2 [Treponema sp.]
MAYVLIMPRQGNTVESCVINEWKVAEGDAVNADTVVCVVETDKATFEVPAGETGQVLKLLYPGGEDVPVLKPIAVIGQAGEDWAAALGSEGTGDAPASGVPASPAVPAAVPAPETDSMAAAPIAEGGRIPASPRARNLAGKEGLPLAGLGGTGPGGRIIERDVAAALEKRPPLTAAAKAALASGGGTLPARGSGLGGRVREADLAAAYGASMSGGGASVSGGGASLPAGRAGLADFGEGAVAETPIKGIRKLIADRMYSSLAESAQFTLNAGASALRIQELRARMKAGAGYAGDGGEPALSKVTVNDLILFAVSRMLPRFPFMNAHKIGDTLRTFERVHLGVAVDTPRGLMVPVIRNANLLSLPQISAEAKRLASACQKGSVNPEEITGSTFTVTNLGSLGITGFTPVLNAPEVGILGVCGIELKPVPADDEGTDCCGVKFEPRIGFSLTINHQVVDGAPAARFLKALGQAAADIDLLLAEG